MNAISPPVIHLVISGDASSRFRYQVATLENETREDAMIIFTAAIKDKVAVPIVILLGRLCWDASTTESAPIVSHVNFCKRKVR